MKYKIKNWYKGESLDPRIQGDDLYFKTKNVNLRHGQGGIKTISPIYTKDIVTERPSVNMVRDMFQYDESKLVAIGSEGGKTKIYDFYLDGTMYPKAGVSSSSKNYVGCGVMYFQGSSNTKYLYYQNDDGYISKLNVNSWTLSEDAYNLGEGHATRGVHASDDIVYFVNNNAVNALDGSTPSSDVFVLPHNIVSIKEFNMYVAVLTYFEGFGSKLFLFDQRQVASDPVVSKFISPNKVHAMEIVEGRLVFITENDIIDVNGNVELSLGTPTNHLIGYSNGINQYLYD